MDTGGNFKHMANDCVRMLRTEDTCTGKNLKQGGKWLGISRTKDTWTGGNPNRNSKRVRSSRIEDTFTSGYLKNRQKISKKIRQRKSDTEGESLRIPRVEDTCILAELSYKRRKSGHAQEKGHLYRLKSQRWGEKKLRNAQDRDYQQFSTFGRK
jgi:hypothetical protein